MNVLSLFDGISCARVALDRAGISVSGYYASEVDKYAIQIAQKNYPDTVQLGSVVGLHFAQTDVGLLIGGSPCQDLSIAKKDRKGLDGTRSGLFWEYVRIRDEVKPRYFILENVASMPKEARAVITDALGVEPVMIDAALVSAQRRKRLFWVGKWNGTKYEQIVIPQPEDRGIFLKDILEDGDTLINPKMQNFKGDTEKSVTLTSSMYKEPPLVLKTKSNTIRIGGRGSGAGDKHNWESVYQYRRTYWRETKGGKVPTITANMGTGGNNVPYVQGAASRTYPRIPNGEKREKRIELNKIQKANSMTLVQGDSMVAIPPKEIRKLTPIECERLQCLPDRWTEKGINEKGKEVLISNTQRYITLGNAFCVDVVAHILSFISNEKPHLVRL